MENNSQHPEKQKERSDAERNIDSPINMRPAEGKNEDLRSLTPDEDSDTNPDQVEDKASFGDRNRDEETGKFDGEIGI